MGEIRAAADFYDYRCEVSTMRSPRLYLDAGASGRKPWQEMRKDAVAIFNAAGWIRPVPRGLLRGEETPDEVVFNEINTLPGLYIHQHVPHALEG